VESLVGAGHEMSIGDLAERYGPELRVHCYRMLGSVHDAEDVVQETLVAAWRGLASFEGRSSVRTWLYRIATNRCLNARRDASRRPSAQPTEPPFPAPAPTRTVAPDRLEPLPDELLNGIPDNAPGPDVRYEAKESVALAFVSALQQLPPRQRAALLLRDVLGFSTAESAAVLGTTEGSVKSAVQRARAALVHCVPTPTAGVPAPASTEAAQLARRFAEAFEADDIDGVLALLTDDAWLVMPQSPLAYQGPVAIASFLHASRAWRAGRRFRLDPVRVNAQPAFALGVARGDADGIDPAGVIALTVRTDGISVVTRFVDPSVTLALPAEPFPVR
jgi:RNA polymerase sigma-70 factor (TIGR02960 family)